MLIRIYVSCCGGDKLAAIVNEAVKQAGVQAEVEEIHDLAELAKAGIVSTPAIRINDRLVVSGRVPKVADLVRWLSEAAAR